MINFGYLALLGALINSGYSHNLNRQPRLSNSKTSNGEPVIAARYKIKGKHYDPSIAETIHCDNFPQVEYPSSIVDSSIPFYLNTSPFSNDVKASFKSLANAANHKPNPTIVVNVKPSEKEKGKIKITSISKVNETKVSKDQSSPNTTETIVNEPSEHACPANANPQLTEDEEMEYVIEFIDDLDKFITTLTDIEAEFIDISNATKIFDAERPDEFVTITSDMTMVNNDTEFNECPLHSAPSLFNPSTVPSSIETTTMGECTTSPISSDDTQDDLSNLETSANDNYNSGTGQ